MMNDGPPPIFDNRDLVILANRVILLDADENPRVGDFVRFLGQPPIGKDGDLLRRISYIWPDEDPGVQTSDSGSYYIGDGYVSMSGGLHPCVRQSALKRTGMERKGSVWFFHHDLAGGGRGVSAEIMFRVYDCKLPAPGRKDQP